MRVAGKPMAGNAANACRRGVLKSKWFTASLRLAKAGKMLALR